MAVPSLSDTATTTVINTVFTSIMNLSSTITRPNSCEVCYITMNRRVIYKKKVRLYYFSTVNKPPKWTQSTDYCKKIFYHIPNITNGLQHEQNKDVIE